MGQRKSSSITVRSLRRCIATLLVAIGAAGCEDLAVAPSRGPSDVLGWIHDDLGNPFPSVGVRVGAAASFSTADGFFRIRDVTPPYDLMIESPQRMIFHGLNNLDPFIVLPYTQSASTYATYVTGRVPWEQGQYWTVLLFGAGMRSVGSEVREPTGTYLLQPRWQPPARTRPATLFILKQGSERWRFQSFVKRPLRISAGERLVLDAALRDFTPIETRSIEVEAILPAGAPHVHVLLMIPFNESWISLNSASAAAGQNVTLQVPVIPDLPMQLLALTDFGSERAEARVDLPSDRARVTAELRAPAILTAPADSANVTRDSALEWSDSEPSGVYEVEMYFEGHGALKFYTGERRIPLTELPFDLKPGTRCRWSVDTLAAAFSVDALLTHPGLVTLQNRSRVNTRERTFFIAATDSLEPSNR